MTTEVIIFKKNPINAPIKVFRLFVETIHGNSQHWSVQTWDFQRNRVEPYLLMFADYFRLPYGKRGRRDWLIEEISAGYDVNLAVVEHLIPEDEVEMCDRAEPQRVWLHWFDEHGVEHECGFIIGRNPEVSELRGTL